MCGIAGFAPLTPGAVARPDDREQLQRMCDVIRHRGPDDQGIAVLDGAALGMRRLSIIDLSSGHQPMVNEDGTVTVVFNGEIYNYRELRRQLEADGHHFTTDSDTETIVHGYEAWGTDVFTHLRGMFGIAIWDARRRRLVLARDRAGIKPLYYTEAGGRVAFGSEAKSLLTLPEVDRQLDAAALDHYLGFLYTPRDRAIFRGMRKLPPGHRLVLEAGRVTVDAWWRLPVDRQFRGTEAEALDQLESTIEDAVRSHLVSDVPIGAFLSGGIDSSVVVALMARTANGPVRTFAVGFEDDGFNELPHARRVAAHLGTDHHEFVVKPDALDVLDRVIWHFDEPFGDASAIPTWYVSEIARRHVTVVLSGDGGDELFGGYDRYLPNPAVARVDRLTGPVGRAMAAATWRLLPHGATGKNLLRHVARDDEGRYIDSVSFYHPDERAALLTGDLRRQLGTWNSEAEFARPFARLRDLPWPARMMAFDFESYLPDDCLTKVDRMSMAHSIESRVPLLDHQVVEFAASLPHSVKLRGDVRKYLLKALAFRLVPRELLDRPKQGFALPVGSWLRGSLRDLLGDTLTSPRARQRGYFEPAFVDRIVAEHLSGRRDHSLRLWQLLVFERWHRAYLDAPAVAA